jgi:hypothetical protein
MKKLTYSILLLGNLLWSMSHAALLSGEGIVLDAATGNSVISYRDGAGTASDPLVQIPFIPSTKIEPTLYSTMGLDQNGGILYLYRVSNGVNAKQSIIELNFFGLPVNANVSGTTTTVAEGNRQMDIFEPTLGVPNLDWYGSGARVPKERFPPNGVVNIGWNYDYSGQHTDPLIGIHPGETLSSFSMASFDLPGLLSVQIAGNGTGHVAFPGYAPSGTIVDLIEQLQNNDFVPVNAAAPMIAVPSPYDAAVTLENIQSHAHTWISKQLLNATFSAQLDTSFQAAIAAYRANQPQTAIIQLQTMRTLIKQQQPDADKNDVTPTINLPAPPAFIDLLAARILYFDLSYVISR